MHYKSHFWKIHLIFTHTQFFLLINRLLYVGPAFNAGTTTSLASYSYSTNRNLSSLVCPLFKKIYNKSINNTKKKNEEKVIKGYKVFITRGKHKGIWGWINLAKGINGYTAQKVYVWSEYAGIKGPIFQTNVQIYYPLTMFWKRYFWDKTTSS